MKPRSDKSDIPSHADHGERLEWPSAVTKVPTQIPWSQMLQQHKKASNHHANLPLEM